MNKDIMQQMGFGSEVKLVEARKCPFCTKPVDVNDFRNEISRRENSISGLCQKCQDDFFGAD